MEVPLPAPAVATLMVSELATLPPAPAQAREKLLVAFSAPVDSLPETARVPDQAPLAVQDVAFVAVHSRVDEPPTAMLNGVALNTSVGADGAGAGAGSGAGDDTATGAELTEAPVGPLGAPQAANVSAYANIASRGICMRPAYDRYLARQTRNRRAHAHR